MQHKIKGEEEQASGQKSAEIQRRLLEFLGPLLVQLDGVLDKRLVRTFVQAIIAIVSFRESSKGLLLSELGSYILNPSQAPAGTKRLSNLLRSKRWGHEMIEHFLWQQSEQRVNELKCAGEEALVVWDESVLEKASSLALEGLCAVRSSAARQLKRIKPGFYTPPSGPIFVPGMHWVGVLVMGMRGAPVVASMRWWTTRGMLQSDKRSEEEKLLVDCVHRWGRRVLHVWDRGFAGAPWLGIALAHNIRFVLRWQKGYKLVDGQGRKAWQICRGKRSIGQVPIWDSPRQVQRHIGVYFTPVTHSDYPDVPLWLIVSRQGPGRQPWYLLTNQPVHSVRQAWHFIRAYARRWQIEMAWRYAKSELAMESPAVVGMGQSSQTSPDGDPGLCLPPFFAHPSRTSPLALTPLVPSNGKAVPSCLDTALSLTLCACTPLACSSPSRFSSTYRKFGMTHVPKSSRIVLLLWSGCRNEDPVMLHR